MRGEFLEFLKQLFLSADLVKDMTSLSTGKHVYLHIPINLGTDTAVWLYEDNIRVEQYSDFERFTSTHIEKLPEKITLTDLGWFALAINSGWRFGENSNIKKPMQLWSFLEMLKQQKAWVDFYKPNRVFWENKYKNPFCGPISDILHKKLLRVQNKRNSNALHLHSPQFRLSENSYSNTEKHGDDWQDFTKWAHKLPSDVKNIVIEAINAGCEIDYYVSGFNSTIAWFGLRGDRFYISRSDERHAGKYIFVTQVVFEFDGERHTWKYDTLNGQFLGQKVSPLKEYN